MKFKKISCLLLFIVLGMAVFSSSCHDEPKEPDPIVIPDPVKPDNPTPEEPVANIPGSQILGTWYYLNPNKALKISITFTSEPITFGYECLISVESELPSFHEYYSNTWKYKDSKWEITRIAIAEAISQSAVVSKVLDNEMWLDIKWGAWSERLKFNRKDPGDLTKPSGIQLAPDGIFGRYLWETTIGQYNLTLQFVSSTKVHETSDMDVMIIDEYNNHRYSKVADCDAGHSFGYLSVDWCKSLITAVTASPYFVVIKESEKKLILYNPFKPDVTYTLTRK